VFVVVLTGTLAEPVKKVRTGYYVKLFVNTVEKDLNVKSSK
jgi:hypothetical protein